MADDNDFKPVQTAPAPAPSAPEFHLSVVHPFDDYRRGDRITEAYAIEAVKNSPYAHHCINVLPQ